MLGRAKIAMPRMQSVGIVQERVMNVLRHFFFEPGRQTQPKGNFSLEICQERFWDFKSWGTFKGKLSNNFWWNCNNSPWGNCNNHGSMVLLLLDITREVASSPFKSHYLVSHCCSNFLILKFGSSVTLVLLRYLSVSVWRNKTGR